MAFCHRAFSRLECQEHQLPETPALQDVGQAPDSSPLTQAVLLQVLTIPGILAILFLASSGARSVPSVHAGGCHRPKPTPSGCCCLFFFVLRVSRSCEHHLEPSASDRESLFMPDIDRESKSALPRTGRLASPSPLLSSTVDASLTADTEPPRSSPHPNDDRAS